MEVHYSPYTTSVSYKKPLFWRLFAYAVHALFALTILFGGLVFYVFSVTTAPAEFPTGEMFVVEDGQSAREIAQNLEQAGFVKSDSALYMIILLFHDPTSIKASTYKFKEPLSTFDIAERLAKGVFGVDVIRFVHFEGERNTKLAERAEAALPNFDTEEFLKLTKDKEGRMFPDTYLIPETYTAKELATLLETTFESKIEPLRAAIADSDYTEEEVIILASLIEREANTRDTKRQVAGVIQNRIREGMPLQLDASVEYNLVPPYTSEDLAAALRSDDTLYNTYTHAGLPPTPIGNPGLTSIEAVLRPLESNYLFYLTGRDGNFYFATTLAEHNRNIALYLR